MEILLSFLYTLLFIYLIFKLNFFNVGGLSQKTISIFFVIKVLSGVAVWLVYTYYYADRSYNDMVGYYNDSLIMFEAIHKYPMHYTQMVLGINTEVSYLAPYYTEMANWYKPWPAAAYHNNRIIIQFNAFVHLFSFGYYHVHTVFMSFLSLIGLTGIYITFHPVLKNKTGLLAIAVYLIPSVLFWSSGLLKESIVVFSVGILLYLTYTTIYRKATLLRVLGVVFCSVILFYTKIYVFIALLPSLLSLIIVKSTKNKYPLLIFLAVHFLIFLSAINMYRIDPYWDVLKILRYQQSAITIIAIQEGAGSIIPLSVLEYNVLSFIEIMPEALVNVLLRPYIFESKTVLMLMAGLENLAFYILAIISIMFIKKPHKEALSLFYTSLFFVFSLAVLIGAVSPVLGSIVRFRVPLLPFFAIIFIMLLNKQKMLKKLPVLKFKYLDRLLK